MKTMKSLIFCLIVILGVSSVATAAPFSEDQIPTAYVKPLGTGDCSSWDDACDLQIALFKKTANLILVAAGTYKPTDTFDRGISFRLESGVMIYGGFPTEGGTWEDRDWVTNLTTLSGEIGNAGDPNDNSYHVVTTSGVNWTARLDGFTISGGNTNGGVNPADYGGGMYNEKNSSPTLTNVTFTGNTALTGGGMGNISDSSPNLTNVIFNGNSATKGGGMGNISDSSPILTNVTFTGNTGGGDGGGMYNNHSSPMLANVNFAGNTARNGAGMYNSESVPTLTDVIFAGNIANDNGGGMYNVWYSNPTLTNVTFSGNSAVLNGGGIYNYLSSPTLTNATIAGNSAGLYGGGMYNWYASPKLTNVIVWGNTPELNQINNNNSTPTITYSDIQGGYAGTGNINLDPLLSPLADNGGFTQTHALDAGSPAIDAGNNAVCTATDQRGFPRQLDGDGNGSVICDMGAYEFKYEPKIYLPMIIK